MSENCSHDCGSCSADCSSRSPQSMIEQPNKESRIDKVIGVVSGKGGVGKSMISSMLAVNLQRKGHRTAIMDADVTGHPFQRHSASHSMPLAQIPRSSRSRVRPASRPCPSTFFWRIPMILSSGEVRVIAGTVKQFWTDVVWKDVDYMIVDMPPGTGDVPLTVFQSLPVDGIVIVTSPQELVSMIVGKAVRMAKMMNVPILGIIENMSYVECPDCGKHINIFGESHVDEVAKQYDLPVLGRIPMTAEIAAASDAGNVEGLEGDWFNDAVAAIEGLK